MGRSVSVGRLDEAFVVLMADDDTDDCLLVKSAFETAGITLDLRYVEDGKELMDYLYRQGQYADPEQSPCPDIILLDLNMPRKDGRESLKDIKSDPVLRSIPVVILTTSREKSDILSTYEAGASSFIIKPLTLEGWSEMAETIGRYWAGIAEIPPKASWC
jgi:CheY-like chemotaxis protein